jgi:hypothetical protein
MILRLFLAALATASRFAIPTRLHRRRIRLIHLIHRRLRHALAPSSHLRYRESFLLIVATHEDDKSDEYRKDSDHGYDLGGVCFDHIYYYLRKF